MKKNFYWTEKRKNQNNIIIYINLHIYVIHLRRTQKKNVATWMMFHCIAFDFKRLLIKKYYCIWLKYNIFL